MRVCKVETNKNEYSICKNIKRYFGCMACIFLYLPTTAYAFIEGSRYGEKIYLTVMFVAVLWSAYIVAFVVRDKDPLIKPVLTIAGLISVNIVVMFFTSMVGLLYSLITLPILIFLLFWVYYEM